MSDAPVVAGSIAEPAQMCTRYVRVADPDVVFVRSVLEAYDGLTQWSGDGSGVLTLAVPTAQAPALDDLLEALSAEVALQVLTIF
jgi:hypothetical protein